MTTSLVFYKLPCGREKCDEPDFLVRRFQIDIKSYEDMFPPVMC